MRKKVKMRTRVRRPRINAPVTHELVNSATNASENYHSKTAINAMNGELEGTHSVDLTKLEFEKVISRINMVEMCGNSANRRSSF